MLDFLGLPYWSQAVINAIEAVVRGKVLTVDLGGSSSTADVGSAVVEALVPPTHSIK
jgi:isocitrate/isopropylmalate dehydrogenase